MDFKEYCAVLFDGNEQRAIQQLALDRCHGEYRLVENEDGHKAILASMTRAQAKAYRNELHRLVQGDSKKEPSSGMKPWLAMVFAIIFLIAFVFNFITAYTDIAKTNELKQTGVLTRIYVTNEDYDSINEDYTYTLSYQVDGKKYTYIGWPGQRYDVGETFDLYIDPEHPRDLVFSSPGDILLSIFPLSISIFFLLLSGRFEWLTKYIVYIIMVYAAAVATAGILLDSLGLTIFGSIVLLIIVTVRFRAHRGKNRK